MFQNLKNITLTHDLVFKEFFGRKGNEIFLKSFLSALLNIDIHTIDVYKDIKLNISNITSKGTIFDIQANINNEIVLNLEMQRQRYTYDINRFSKYGCELTSQALKRGESYEKLKSTIAVWILDYDIFEYDDFITEGVVVSKEHRDVEISLLPKYYFIELNKFKKLKNKEVNELNDWLTFIAGTDKEEVKKVMSRNLTIEEASKRLDELLADEALMRQLRARDKSLSDYNSLMHDAKERGLAEGRAEGISQGMAKGVKYNSVKIAQKMIKEGLDIQMICKLTSLSKREVSKLA